MTSNPDEIVEHRVYKCTCTCGKVVEGDFPAGANNVVKYGKNIETLIG